MLVTRSHWSGLRLAQTAATEWASDQAPGIELLGLVVMPDAPGRLPKPLRDLARVVGGGVPRVWHLPWVEDWRLAHDDTRTSCPREAVRLTTDLQHLLHAR